MVLRSLPPLKTFQSEPALSSSVQDFAHRGGKVDKTSQSPAAPSHANYPDDDDSHAERLRSAKGDGHYLV